MGKSGNKIKGGDAVKRPSSLANDLLSKESSSKVKKKSSIKQQKQYEDEKNKTEVVDEVLSQKILKQARQQIDDIAHGDSFRPNRPTLSRVEKFSSATRDADESDNESEDFNFDDADLNPEIDEADEQALNKFMSGDPSKNRTLCDIIMEKIEEKRFELDSQMSDLNGGDRQKLDPRLVSMYEDVGKVLSTYRSGKLPKAFKILPKLTNWEQILIITHPEKWTPASMYQATRIFVSNLNVKMCQRFLSLILLPRIRDDIAEHKKLNFHLYRALAKALFKPAAFFKAILLPICETGTCTLREATIIGSVITKRSIPSLHAAAAMLKIAEMDYSGSSSLFLRIFIDKKYTLPYRVIDGLVNHFIRFINDDRQLPVLWHQCLLSFCQRYKSDLSTEQREHLMDLVKKQYHVQISPEIRRELCGTESRDLEDQEPAFSDADMSE